jgi:hypothetical protein
MKGSKLLKGGVLGLGGLVVLVLGLYIGRSQVGRLVGLMLYRGRLPPMTAEEYVACDMSGDKDCDEEDFTLFKKALGNCQNRGHYISPADADLDGCVTVEDLEVLYPRRSQGLPFEKGKVGGLAPTVYPMEEWGGELCDLDNDGDCDGEDEFIFYATIGACRGESGYLIEADIDGDGCVKEGDGEGLFPESSKEFIPGEIDESVILPDVVRGCQKVEDCEGIECPRASDRFCFYIPECIDGVCKCGLGCV